MAAYVATPSYLRSRRSADPRRMIAFVVIGGLHVAALAALFVVRESQPPQPPQPMMVTFISETPPQPEPTPPPPEPVKPKPQPKMIATPKPTPSAITAPPIEDTPIEEAPKEEAPPTPPAPAAEPAPPAIVPPNFVAAYLNNPGPTYPATSVKLREEGTVTLLVLVNVDGRADKVLIDRSSGYPRLDDAAVDVVKKRWRFVAARQGEKTVAAWVRVPVAFELTNKH
ncbi:MAG: energy transducer TonB [Solimonas sp.]